MLWLQILDDVCLFADELLLLLLELRLIRPILRVVILTLALELLLRLLPAAVSFLEVVR